MEVSELYSAVVAWAGSTGARDLNKTPGLWHGKTREMSGLGPLDVRINAHDETIDGVPPFNIKIGMDDYFPGLIGIIGPDGGTLIDSPRENENEAGLIAHFKAQTEGQS